jgi:hypothetical protein
MKAFKEPLKNRFSGLASSFSLSEKWPRDGGGPTSVTALMS